MLNKQSEISYFIEDCVKLCHEKFSTQEGESITFAVIGHVDTEFDLWRNFPVNKTVL